MERRILAARNKIEDGEIFPKYCKTEDMLADIGTKALEPARFEILRDLMTGYGVLDALKRGNWNELSVLMTRLANRGHELG